jgi:hypothetical protein
VTEALVYRPNVPVGDRGSGRLQGQYHDQLKASRQLTPEEWLGVFQDRTIITIPGESHTFAIILRPEFDVPPGCDHMIVAEPHYHPGSPDFYELSVLAPADALTMLRTTFAVLHSYRQQGCDHVRAVLNCSSYDSGAIFRGTVVDKQRLPQSLMVPHFKTGGLKLREIPQSTILESETPYLNRPLQSELNQIVKYLSQKLDISVSDGSLPAIAVSCGSDPGKLISLYQQLHRTMFEISSYSIGYEGIHLESHATGTNHQRTPTVTDSTGRVSNDDSVKSITEWLGRESSRPGTLVSQSVFRDDLTLSALMAQYLTAQRAYLEAHPAQTMIFGPSYSMLIHGVTNEPVTAHFVPAEFVPKGANTIVNEFPQETRRALTPAEVEAIRIGNGKLYDYLQGHTPFHPMFNLDFDLQKYADSFN